jgi:hypothetical protein
MKATIKNGTLTIEIPVNTTPVLSKSGKSKIVASSNGNVKLADVLIEGKPLTIGLNAYISA